MQPRILLTIIVLIIISLIAYQLSQKQRVEQCSKLWIEYTKLTADALKLHGQGRYHEAHETLDKAEAIEKRIEREFSDIVSSEGYMDIDIGGIRWNWSVEGGRCSLCKSTLELNEYRVD
jgi:hypothetical protein